MGVIPKIKEDWENKIPIFRNKAMSVLNSGNEKTSGVVAPYLDGNGKLVSPLLEYVNASGNSGITEKVGNYIQQATAIPNPRNGKAFLPLGTVVDDTALDRSATTTSSGSTTASNSSIVDAAQKYMGTPYVYGGSSASEGLDCSGFVYNTLKDAGYDVVRTSAEGYRKNGTAVDKANLQPGDLVFYGKGSEATHTGIYIGNGQIMHSSGGRNNTSNNPGKGVTVSSIDYRSDFIGAKRY